MVPSRSIVETAVHHDPALEARKEALTMALYVAVSLLGVLTALAESADTAQVETLAVIWGTTIGLALAHWFAFQVSARFVAAGAVRRHDAESAVAQILGAAAVAALASVPVVLLPATAELDAVRLVLAGLLALVGFGVARSTGAGMVRSVLYAATLLLVASSIAVIKNVLSHH